MQSLQVPTELMEGFRPPASMTPEELGNSLARLVWESFSDFLSQDEPEVTLQDASFLELLHERDEAQLVPTTWAVQHLGQLDEHIAASGGSVGSPDRGATAATR